MRFTVSNGSKSCLKMGKSMIICNFSQKLDHESFKECILFVNLKFVSIPYKVWYNFFGEMKFMFFVYILKSLTLCRSCQKNMLFRQMSAKNYKHLQNSSSLVIPNFILELFSDLMLLSHFVHLHSKNSYNKFL